MTGAPFDALDATERFEHALSVRDEGAAVRLVERLLEDGADPVTVLVDVIGAAQREVGRRWQRDVWSITQEHAATAVSTAAAAIVARYAGRVPVTEGRIVLACAEREWHLLPAMIVAGALRAGGWDVTLLGASTSLLRLGQHLHDLGPDATAVSCSVLGALPTTRRFIEASSGMGIPVMAGGAALGADGVRAHALGATAWAPGPRQAVAVLEGLPTVVPPAARLPAGPAAEQSALESLHLRLAGDVREQWSPTSRATGTGRYAGGGAVEGVAHDVVHQALHAVSAALITGDPRLLPETAAWIAEVLVARGADPELVAELGRLLAATLREFPLATGLVERHWAAGLR